MKIGFDAKRLFHNTTGLGNYSRNLVRALRKARPEWEIHLFSPTVKKSAETKEFLSTEYHIHTKPTGMPSYLYRTYWVSKKINALQLDIFHGLSQELPFGIHDSTKRMVTIHDMIPYVIHSQFSWSDTIGYKLKVNSACKRADHIIAISNSTKKDIVSILNIDAQKISVCYQSCDEVFQYVLHQEFNKQYLLYVGSINERKGLCDIIEAYAMSPDEMPKMIVIGEGRAYKQKALNLINEKKLQHKFNFKGTVPNKDLVDYYRNAYALVLPSKYEGFGIPIIEALYVGCAVICYNNSSLPEAAGPGGLVVETGNIAALNRAMMDIKNSHFDYAEAGYIYVADRYNTKKSINDYIRLYEKQISTNQNKKYP